MARCLFEQPNLRATGSARRRDGDDRRLLHPARSCRALARAWRWRLAMANYSDTRCARRYREPMEGLPAVTGRTGFCLKFRGNADQDAVLMHLLAFAIRAAIAAECCPAWVARFWISAASSIRLLIVISVSAAAASCNSRTRPRMLLFATNLEAWDRLRLYPATS